jgi:hypothetical protein
VFVLEPVAQRGVKSLVNGFDIVLRVKRVRGCHLPAQSNDADFEDESVAWKLLRDWAGGMIWGTAASEHHTAGVPLGSAGSRFSIQHRRKRSDGSGSALLVAVPKRPCKSMWGGVEI